MQLKILDRHLRCKIVNTPFETHKQVKWKRWKRMVPTLLLFCESSPYLRNNPDRKKCWFSIRKGKSLLDVQLLYILGNYWFFCSFAFSTTFKMKQLLLYISWFGNFLFLIQNIIWFEKSMKQVQPQMSIYFIRIVF